MEFYQKLPRNKKEFVLYLAVISIISVNIIAPIITFLDLQVGFNLDVYVSVLQVLPFIWLSVIALVLITYKPASFLTSKVAKEGDSFSAHIIINIMFSVLLMSVFLTVIGTWIGCRQISMEPITGFFYKWPRNFSVSFAIEACVAQPIARAVMSLLHKRLDAKNPANEQASAKA